MTIRTTFRVLVLAVALLIGVAAGPERNAAGACRRAMRSSSGTRSPKTRSSGRERSKTRATCTWRMRSDSGLRTGGCLAPGWLSAARSRRSGYRRRPRPRRCGRLQLPTRRSALPLPAAYTSLDPLNAQALAAIPDGPAKVSGMQIGLVAANQVIKARSVNGLMMPIGISSSFPTLKPGPGVWRLTPPFAPAQTPWVGNVRPFILQSAGRFARLRRRRSRAPTGSRRSTRSRRTAPQTAACVPSRRPTSRPVRDGKRDPAVQRRRP